METICFVSYWLLCRIPIEHVNNHGLNMARHQTSVTDTRTVTPVSAKPLISITVYRPSVHSSSISSIPLLLKSGLKHT